MRNKQPSRSISLRPPRASKNAEEKERERWVGRGGSQRRRARKCNTNKEQSSRLFDYSVRNTKQMHIMNSDSGLHGCEHPFNLQGKQRFTIHSSCCSKRTNQIIKNFGISRLGCKVSSYESMDGWHMAGR
jgi:hypothetical protein